MKIAAATSLAPKDKASPALGVCFGSTALASVKPEAFFWGTRNTLTDVEYGQLFGPSISGQILTHDYTPVSIWYGAVDMAGFVAQLGAQLSLDRRLLVII